MARGQQKLQSQKKNLEKQQTKAKQVDNKAAAKAALHYTCSICKVFRLYVRVTLGFHICSVILLFTCVDADARYQVVWRALAKQTF